MSISEQDQLPAFARGDTQWHAPERRQDTLEWENNLGRNWRRWTDIVESIAHKRRVRDCGDRGDYTELHRDLLGCCRVLAEENEPRRDFYRLLEGLVRPWLSLRTLAQTDSETLLALSLQCREIDRRLNGRRLRVKGRWVLGLALVSVTAALVVLFPSQSAAILQSALDEGERAWKAMLLTYRQSSDTQRLILLGFLIAVISMVVAWRTR
jgi:hypothetical protein